MRDILLDLVKQTSALVETLRITGTEEETVIKGSDKDKTIFIEAKLKQPILDFVGEFGMTNINLLNGLLGFTNYRSDDATFSVKRRERNGKPMVEQFEFRNPVTGNSADFRMMDPQNVPEQATITGIPWNVIITPTKSKLSEFTQLGHLYNEVDKSFGVKVVDGDLRFQIGDEASASHRASMVFEAGVEGEIKNSPNWNTQRFMSIVKMMGAHPATLKISARGVILLSVETPYAVYNYFLPADR